MNTKKFGPQKSLAGLAALFCALALNSCDLPEGPALRSGTGTLTLVLPGPGASAAPSRAVLSDKFIGALQYRVTITGDSGEILNLKSGGGGITVSLKAGIWTVQAEAYDPASPDTLVGKGSAVVTIAAGQDVQQQISMSADPDYEALLKDIYIHNEADLRRVGTDFAIDGAITFYLERDIVLTGPWTPLGDGGGPFKAVFDGQGHTVTIAALGAAKKTGDSVYQGFFARAEEGAVIKNTTFKYELGGPVDISTGDASTYRNAYAGGVAGYAKDTVFDNLRVLGNFSVLSDAGLSAGGIAGSMSHSEITASSAESHIRAEANSSSAGGIAGAVTGGGGVKKSYAAGAVESVARSDSRAGGIAGQVEDSAIELCYAWAAVSAEGAAVYAGGIAGSIDKSSGSPLVSACYALGSVASLSSAASVKNGGGIAGRNNGAQITSCAALNDRISLSPSETIGAIAGFSGPGSVFAKNYAAGDMIFAVGDTISSGPAFLYNPDLKGNSANFRSAFAGPPAGKVYGSAALDWNFVARTGAWKWISGYSYPALAWQEAPPQPGPASEPQGGGGITIEWP